MAWIIFYAAGLSFALGEITQFLPRNLYALAFLATLLGSIALEVIHFIRQADQRREVILLAISLFIAFIPSISFGFLVAAGMVLPIGPITFFALPFMPLAYFYVIYRRQLGGLEVRLNRFVSLYAFLILFGTAILMLVVPIASMGLNPESWTFLGILFILATAFITITVFPAFQAFVEKRFLGIKLPYQNLQETYSGRITTSASISSLLQLLNDEVLPSLLVRQFAFIQVFNGNLKTLLARNVDPQQLPHESDMDELASQVGKYPPAFSPDMNWVRVILPLKVGDSFIGFWLLGRRDPDDIYPQAEIPILQSIANQTAIAMSNLLHAEQLRKMYQSDVQRYEKERMRLALELHDSVLNELAVLRTNLDASHLTPKFLASYEEVTNRLRDIVTDLRPPMLSYGLKPAIEGLADNLMERSKDTVNVVTDLHIEGETRYTENIEQNLFRITQEACENAVRHAHAANIKISGWLYPQKIILKIEDDGTGFDIGQQLDLDTLVSHNHFGLAGIVERVHLIDGEINIRSMPQTGTNIQITWIYNPEKSY